MTGLKSRQIIYAFVVAVCLSAIALRIGVVNAGRIRPIISYYSQWQKDGKPVEVKTVEAKDVPVYSRFTVKVSDGRLAEGFVTGDVKDVLREGQDIYDEDRAVPCAAVRKAGKELDIGTGMFPVQVIFNSPRDPGAFFVVSAHTRTLRDVLAVPNEVLDISGGEYFIWQDDNGFARKKKVSVGARDGYGAVITSGLRSGDKVVFNGQSGLRENEKLLVQEQPAAVGEEKKQ